LTTYKNTMSTSDYNEMVMFLSRSKLITADVLKKQALSERENE